MHLCGSNAGIDLALALVEADLGRAIAAGIAKELVLFLHRPGGQAQFSTMLAAQTEATSRFSEFLAWMTDHPKVTLRFPR